MKNLFSNIFLMSASLAATLTVSSCSEDNYLSGIEDAKVFTFAVELPSTEMRTRAEKPYNPTEDAQADWEQLVNDSRPSSDLGDSLDGGMTRAEGGTTRYGDGSTVNNLMCYVYNSKAESNALPIRTEAITIQDMDGKRGGSLAIDLPTAGVYDFVFIATSCPQDDKASKLWFDPTARSLNVNYDRMTANDEAADCFYYTLKNISVSSGSNHSVALKRPMAQMNIGTKDLTDYNTMSSSELKSVGVSVDGVYTSMNVMDGSVTGEPEKVTFSQAVLPSGQVFPASGATYLSMNYLLVNERRNVDVTMTAQNASSSFTTDIPNVPLQRNHQTNVYGNLLTKANDFKIEINPDFAGSNKLDADDPYADYDLVLQFDKKNSGMYMYCYDVNNELVYSSDLSNRIDSNLMVYLNFDDLLNYGISNISFASTKNLTEVIKCDMSKFNITSYHRMFKGCSNLRKIQDIGSWDTSSIRDMSEMFDNCKSLITLDLSSFDTSKVTTMSHMFSNCTSLSSLDLSSFDTSNVNTMEAMFYYCESISSLDLTNFNTSNVTTMKWMFSQCYNLTFLNICNFITSNVQSMTSMFDNCLNLVDLSVSSFDTHNVLDMSYMFCNCHELNSLDLSNFDTSNVRDMSEMFANCHVSNLDLSKFDTSNVFDMSGMFSDVRISSLNISNFNTSNVESMAAMFKGAIISCPLYFDNFDTSKVKSMYRMFMEFSIPNDLDLSNFDTSNVRYMNEMFAKCEIISNLDLSNFNTCTIITMEEMFANCAKLTTLNLSSFDTENVLTMKKMFNGCQSLASLDLSSFDTSKVTSMASMFYDCQSLATIDLSSFDTSKVTSMASMFYDCRSLATLDLSSFDMSNVVNTSGMFSGCPAEVIW